MHLFDSICGTHEVIVEHVVHILVGVRRAARPRERRAELVVSALHQRRQLVGIEAHLCGLHAFSFYR